MEKIARKLTDLVGNTPLLELSNYNTSNDLKARLIVKIESFNPAGSVIMTSNMLCKVRVKVGL